ncbi:MFS transporter, partial [bacterium]|nr:MFS transporter [bacterium]
MHPEVFSIGTFSLRWYGVFMAGAAALALIVARGWLIYVLSDSSLWVGVVTFAAMIPRVIVTPFSGYLADRFDRKSV